MNKTIIYLEDALDAFGLSEKTRKYGGDHSGYDTRMLYEIQGTLESLPPAQPEHIQNNSVHLCDSCQYTYVTCPSHGNDAVFGDGDGMYNICACNKYRPISAQPELEEFEWCHDCKEYDQEKHCCHRFTKVIRNTVEELKAYPIREDEAIKYLQETGWMDQHDKEMFDKGLNVQLADDSHSYDSLIPEQPERREE